MSAVRDLLDQLAARGVTPRGVADDSRQVRPGDLFLAYPGDMADGRRYIADALARGAVAVVWQPDGQFAWPAEHDVPNVAGADLRALAGPLAHHVYGHPSESLSLIAVTGTNGKTSITQFLAAAYAKPCAVIGTLGAGMPGALQETGFTTPEATTLMRCLADFREAGAAACALEASSIGIEEGRMNGARVDVAVFTNMTRDHLDYHGDMAAYAAAKARLFTWPRLRTAIINVDDAFGRELARQTTAARVLAYSLGDAPADCLAVVRAEALEQLPGGLRFQLVLPNGRATVDSALVGRYNVANLLAVAAVLHDAGLPADDVAARLSALSAPAGRMERLGGDGQPLVVVDYAHTPDALENTLLALQPVAERRGGRLAVVFGCGGDRDPGKRPEMGAIAERLAGRVIVTSDNPRREDPLAIIADIRRGMAGGETIPERSAAIERAVAEAAAGDVILLAGKGHENYQECAGVRTHFSDREEALAALARREQRQREVA